MTGIALRGDTGRRSVAQEGTAARRASLDLARRTFAHPGNDAYPSTSTDDGAPPAPRRAAMGRSVSGDVNRCGFRSHLFRLGKVSCSAASSGAPSRSLPPLGIGVTPVERPYVARAPVIFEVPAGFRQPGDVWELQLHGSTGRQGTPGEVACFRHRAIA